MFYTLAQDGLLSLLDTENAQTHWALQLPGKKKESKIGGNWELEH